MTSLPQLLARALLGSLALPLAAVAQTTWHVDVNHPNPPGSGTPGDPYTSLQYAIDQPTTQDGDLVSVQPGTYVELVDFLGKDLRVESTGGRDVTILDGAGMGSVVSAKSGEPATARLKGFTVRGGVGTYDPATLSSRGGGVYCAQSSLQVHDCRLEDNATLLPATTTVKGAGGGAFAEDAPFFSLFDTIVEDNQASQGGGVWLEDSSALVFLCELRGNIARSVGKNSAGWGGGLGASGTNLNFDLCVVEDNVAESLQFVPARGGGLLVWGGSGSVLNSLIANNASGLASTGDFQGQGGGIEVMFLDQPQDLLIGGCEITGNLAATGGAGILGTCELAIVVIHGNTGQSGAGVYSFGIEARDVDIHDNLPVDATQPAFGLGWFNEPTSTSLVKDSKIHGHAGIGRGIGVHGGEFRNTQISANHAVGPYASEGAGAFGATLFQCRLWDNRALETGTATPGAHGGGLADSTAERCLLFANLADVGAGAENCDLVHCTLEGNTAGVSGGGLAGGSATNSILWNNSPEDVTPPTAVTWSNVGSGAPGVGNLSVDPEFWMPPNQDYFLRPTSPCIDAGDPASPNDPDGSRADMGAYAFYPPHFAPPYFYCTAKVNSQGCTPILAFANAPTLSAGGPLVISASEIVNQQFGILFWGTAPAAIPFQDGFLCVAPQVTRTGLQQSGGSTTGSDCTGTFAFQWTSAYAASQNLVPGSRVFAQYWYRDPASASTTGLTGGVDITFIP